MRVIAGLFLVLLTPGLLGMGVLPAANRAGADRDEDSEREDKFLIAELKAVEEQAAAENHEFFQSLDLLRDVPAEKRSDGKEEAN